MKVLITSNPTYIQDPEFNKFNVEPITYIYTYPDKSTNKGIVYVVDIVSMETLSEFDAICRTKNPRYFLGLITNYEPISTYLNASVYTLDNRFLVEQCVISLLVYEDYIE